MIYRVILNEMSVDELKNYASHFAEMEERFGELNFAKDEVIECLQHLCNSQKYMHDCLIKYTAKQGCLHKIEKEMENKYEYALPKPCCEITGESE